MIKDQDRRAIEAMCSCGMDLDTLCMSFPDFDSRDIKEIYDNFEGVFEKEVDIKIGVNCS
jgi:hypothetical protein